MEQMSLMSHLSRYQHPIRIRRVAAGAGGLLYPGLGAAAAFSSRPSAGSDQLGLPVSRVSQVAPGQGGAQQKCFYQVNFNSQKE